MSEYLGSFEDIANPVPLKDFCNINMQISAGTELTLDLKSYSSEGYLGDPMLIYWDNEEVNVIPENLNSNQSAQNMFIMVEFSIQMAAMSLMVPNRVLHRHLFLKRHGK